MPRGDVLAEIQQRVVAARGDENDGAAGENVGGDMFYARDQRLIFRMSALSVRLPGDLPLVLEAAAIGGEDFGVSAVGNQLAERCFAEMMDENIFGAGDAQSRGAGAM